MAEARGGVGTRLYVAGGQEAKRDWAEFRDDGKRTFSEIGAAARGANPALLSLSRGVGTVKDDVKGLANEAGAAGRYLGVFGGVGVAAAAGMAGLAIALSKAREALDFGDEIGDTATRLRVSAEGLQEWRFAAAEAGLEANAFEQAVEAANSALGKAQSGLKGSAGVIDAYGLLGISKAQIDQVRSIEELLPMIADGLQKIGSEAERAAIADKLGVRALLPLLSEGSDRIAEMRDEARDLGLVLDNETVKSMGDMQREVEKASQAIDMQLKTAFLGLAPVLLYLSKLTADFAVQLNNFFEGFKRAEDRSTQSIEARRGKVLSLMTQLQFTGDPNGPAGRTRMNDLRTEYDSLGVLLSERNARAPQFDAPVISGDLASVAARSRGGGRSRDTRTSFSGLLPNEELTAYDPLTGEKLNAAAIAEAALRESAVGPKIERAKEMVIDIDPDLSFQKLNDQLDRMAEESGRRLRMGIEDGLRALADGDIWGFLKAKLSDALFSGGSNLLAGLFEGGGGGGGFGSSILKGISAIFGGGRMAAGGTGEAGRAYSMAEYGGAELAVFGQRGQVFSHDDTVRLLRDASGGERGGVNLGGFTFAPVYQVTGTGEEIERLKRRLDSDQAGFEARVVGTVNNALERRQISAA